MRGRRDEDGAHLDLDVRDGLLVVDRATQLLRERLGGRPDDARRWLREHAEEHRLTLVEAARAVVDGHVAP